jgi:ceramide glucosyltransferase
MSLDWDPLVNVPLVLATLSLALSTVCHLLLWFVIRERPSSGASAEPVTILKPLCGADGSLAENLDGFGRQTHRRLEIVFGVADVGDDALPFALRFCREHPGVATRIRVGERSRVHNPKVALLEHMSSGVSGEWIVISDSNVRVAPEYVADALARAAPDVGLVTHLVVGRGGSSFGALLENLQLNCFIAPAVCGVRFLAGRTCVIGKSMFLRRSALERIGGLAAAGAYLAEDHVIGRALEEAGYRVVTSPLPVTAWHEGWTLQRFISRHLRWAVMRRRVSRAAYAMELVLTPGPLLATVTLLALLADEGALNLGWVLGSAAASQLLAMVSFAKLTKERLPLWALPLNLAREWLALAIWCSAWFVQNVEWRGRVYRVGKGSILAPRSDTLASEVAR